LHLKNYPTQEVLIGAISYGTHLKSDSLSFTHVPTAPFHARRAGTTRRNCNSHLKSDSLSFTHVPTAPFHARRAGTTRRNCNSHPGNPRCVAAGPHPRRYSRLSLSGPRSNVWRSAPVGRCPTPSAGPRTASGHLRASSDDAIAVSVPTALPR
jgi:hypothetical protein